MAPTALARQRKVEDIARVRGEASHIIIDDSVMDSVVGVTVSMVEPVAVLQPPSTPVVVEALEDQSLLDSYFTHVASLIWWQRVFNCLFYVFGYLFM